MRAFSGVNTDAGGQMRWPADGSKLYQLVIGAYIRPVSGATSSLATKSGPLCGVYINMEDSHE